MAKFARLAALAVTLGPKVFQMVQTYGPMLKKMAEQNPETVDNITGKLKQYNSAKKKSGVDGAQQRVDLLREQVTYLYASANTPDVAENARRWGQELTKIEVALPLIDAMSPKSRRVELRKVDDKIDSLSTRILAAVVQDDVEDAEVVVEDDDTL